MSEDSLPFAIDPDTLETIGPWDYNGQYTSPSHAAHPKVDPKTGELITYGYEARGDGTRVIAYFNFDKTGKKTEECWFEAPWMGMTHDIAVTENYVVFLMFPLEINSQEKQKAGAHHYEWKSHLPLSFGLIPRRNPKPEDIKWFEYKNAYSTHIGNAYEENGMVVFDTLLAMGNRMYYFDPPHAQNEPGNVPQTKYCRFRIDPKATEMYVEPEALYDSNGEFPIIDSRYAQKPYKYCFIVVAPPDEGNKVARGPMATNNNTIVMIDTHKKTATSWFAGPYAALHEVAFTPRSPDAPEGDGYLISVVNRQNLGLSSIAILDTRDLSAGPIGIVNLPFRLRMGTHGTWVPASELAKNVPLCDMHRTTQEIVDKFGDDATKSSFGSSNH